SRDVAGSRGYSRRSNRFHASPTRPTAEPHAVSGTAPEKRDQRPGRVQRLCGRGTANGRPGQGQRLGSVSNPVSQQRDEGRRTGTFDGRLSADGQSGQDAGNGAEGFDGEPLQSPGVGAAGLHQAGDGGSRPERATESYRRRPVWCKGLAVPADGEQAGWHAGCGFPETESADGGDLQRRGGHKRLPGQGLCEGPAVSAGFGGRGSGQPARRLSAGARLPDGGSG